MKKVLLVTLWDYSNFGNRLQAIALKKMIEHNGYKVDCVPNSYSDYINRRLKKTILYFLGNLGISRYRYVYRRSNRVRCLKKSSIRLLSPETRLIHNFKVLGKINPDDYIAAVVGSDQVWHKWTRFPKELDFYYLRFMPIEKRISYAASFGFENFPIEDKSIHVKGLNEMGLISCREKTGCELVHKSTSKQVELVLDPTLCVEKRFWDDIEQQPLFSIKNKYIFVMLLGNKDSYLPIIQDYAIKKNLAIFDLTDYRDDDVWKITINNFIWLVHHAEIVCTDSFHCSVFSILYERPMNIFHREENGFEHMFDRIATLLDLCCLQQCEFSGNINDCIPDYYTAKEHLKPMIEKSKTWLSSALNKSEQLSRNE